MSGNDNYVKILFRFFSNVLDEITVETMWATIVDEEKGFYKIDNIPFYASIATDDIVFAEYDKDEEMLTYRETIAESGNSIIQVVVMDKTVDKETIRDMFKNLGCESEGLNPGYFTMEVPAVVDYKVIKTELEKLESQDIIGYAEPVLGINHQY